MTARFGRTLDATHVVGCFLQYAVEALDRDLPDG